ncbi:MAG: YcaO-like family protein [Actinomycetaceae bacterium]|nr:YcaO-like family protein [Actinomycetaceae bacterium]
MLATERYTKLLSPEVGLAASHELAALTTKPTIYNLIIDVGQRLGGGEFGLDDRVGAWDVSLAGVLRRGVGEAVERYALRPPQQESHAGVEQEAQAERVVSALRLPTPGEQAEWMGATRVRKDAGGVVRAGRALVDADWVNLPASAAAHGRRWFGTPSGTASHIGLDAAIDSSLRELVERDAITRAWNGLLEVERVETLRGACKSARKLAMLRESFPLHLYRVRPLVGGSYAYMAWNIEEGFAAAGSSLKGCEACAALHASIEALQVGALLREVKESAQVEVGAGSATFADLSGRRMSFWASEEGLRAWREWDERATEVTVDAGRHSDKPLTSEDVANAGYTHIWVDLSDRLPSEVLGEGFRVVKSFIPELFALPMSEGEPWNEVPGGNPPSFWEPLL